METEIKDNVKKGIKKMVEKTNENTSFVVKETSKANSFEVGASSKRLKLYFDSVDELKSKLEELKKAGLYNEE